MELSLTIIITLIYVSINVLITLIVSIIGVTYVRREFLLQKKNIDRITNQRESVSINEESPTMESIKLKNVYASSRRRSPILSGSIIFNTKHIRRNKTKSNILDDEKEEIIMLAPKRNEKSFQDSKSDNEGNDLLDQKEFENGRGYAVIKPDKSNAELVKLSKMNFVKLWFKMVWKMRTVYLALAVHLFDVLTDFLVLFTWWHLEQMEGDIKDINSRVMALCGLFTLLFHKLISTAAFWMKEENVHRCILQFFDLLIFQEIYISHKKIVAQFKNRTAQKAVETTTSFKYIRTLEAVFESIPQSILQIVFILRTVREYTSDILVISSLSIFQSIVSMTNSIVENDNVYMNTPKWTRHKQRLPPTLPFLKHALCRLSEVFYRISLLSLFWTVCGGTAFSILL
eukprot:166763_1